MRVKKIIKILLMLAGLLIFMVVMYFAVNVWKLCTFRIGKTIYIDMVDADAEYVEYIYSMRNSRSHGDPNVKLGLLDKKVLVKLIKYMKKNNLKICDGEYAIPQTSTFKELIEILDFEEDKKVTDMEKRDKLIKKKVKFAVGVIIVLMLFVIVSRLIIIFSGDMPAMVDIYFLAYDSRTLETILYRYDADLKKTNEVGKVAGYFHNCKIDSEKKYITGACNLWPEEKHDDTESEFKPGIVRYSLEDGTLTLLRSEQQMRIGNKQSIFWDSCFPFDNGEKILMCYADEENNFSYLLYDLETSKAKKIGMTKMDRGVCDIRKGNIWYLKRNGVMQYNAKTGELKQFLQNADVCTVSDDSRKASYFGSDNKKIFLYDTVRKKKIGTLKAGWNKAFGSLFPYSCGWDQSGNYFCYIEHFIKFFGSSDTRIKVYNLHTKTSKCIFLHRNASATVQYEFVRNAD